MDEQDRRSWLVRASDLLAKCEFFLRHHDGKRENPELLARARHCCDEAEKETASGDTEATTTIAILRSMAATLTLRHVVMFDVKCDFDDADGTFLNGIEQYDKDGVSRPLAEQAVQATRAALNADPDDSLVPLQLGHALTWSGDREGAVAAYEEALRRNPLDRCPRSALAYLGSAPTGRPSPNEMSHGRHGFALLRLSAWISNNDWDTGFLLFGSVTDAHTYVERALDTDTPTRNFVLGESETSEYEDDDEFEDEDDEFDEGWRAALPLLQIHRPGRRVDEYELNARINLGSDGKPLRVDWSDIPVTETMESPLPPGRPLRIGDRTCFYEHVE
ncbi:tetratricopeptide repeat protein [Actinoallomurus sp. CA-150999]|uniref:tetratricopeptide repeat protein n=1 Tax=Actinoallomurus sp. CA-150999 TaxID=3239887 RepID=UPI003D926582